MAAAAGVGAQVPCARGSALKSAPKSHLLHVSRAHRARPAIQGLLSPRPLPRAHWFRGCCQRLCPRGGPPADEHRAGRVTLRSSIPQGGSPCSQHCTSVSPTVPTLALRAQHGHEAPQWEAGLGRAHSSHGTLPSPACKGTSARHLTCTAVDYSPRLGSLLSLFGVINRILGFRGAAAVPGRLCSFGVRLRHTETRGSGTAPSGGGDSTACQGHSGTGTWRRPPCQLFAHPSAVTWHRDVLPPAGTWWAVPHQGGKASILLAAGGRGTRDRVRNRIVGGQAGPVRGRASGFRARSKLLRRQQAAPRPFLPAALS